MASKSDTSRPNGDSSSPQALRHGNQDVSETGPGEVTSKTGDLGYDANPRKGFGTDPWAPSH
jgi:hypothetical protein